jgi:hypothetical protein
VSVRITTRWNRSRSTAVVRVEGWLDAAGAAELERVVAGLAGRVSLHLSGLKSADDAGLVALRGMWGRGVRLTGLSPYLRLLLGRRPRASGRGENEVRPAGDGAEPASEGG